VANIGGTKNAHVVVELNTADQGQTPVTKLV
jgi:hypothetical protein